MAIEALDEAYDRLHQTGPEWGGNLANHGPMVAEVLARCGHADEVEAWVDGYLPRLEALPAASDPITDDTWPDALGGRVADWAVYLTRQTGERPWRDVLATWWPRLLPGVAAGATHGVIRTGHAVRTLLAGDESESALTELAHALAYWAARSTTVPGVSAPTGDLSPAAALDAVPAIADQSGPIRLRLGRLGNSPGWPAAVSALAPVHGPEDVPDRLAEVVTAATMRYRSHGHGSPVLLVHTATAPNAIRHALPALATDQWVPSLVAGWAASAAITAMFAPPSGRPATDLSAVDETPADVLERACALGDEHAIKFADTAIDVYERTGDHAALAAAQHATALLTPS